MFLYVYMYLYIHIYTYIYIFEGLRPMPPTLARLEGAAGSKAASSKLYAAMLQTVWLQAAGC